MRIDVHSVFNVLISKYYFELELKCHLHNLKGHSQISQDMP